MTRTLYGEARGEPGEGIVGVAWVIRTRVCLGGWWAEHPGDGIPDGTLAAVCRDPQQFTCWSAGDVNLAKLRTVPLTDPDLARCLRHALNVLTDRVSDPTAGATHYLNPAALKRMPSWYRDELVTRRIGRHVFLRLRP